MKRENKRMLMLSVSAVLLLVPVGVAQAELRIDFSQTGDPVEAGFQGYFADHEQADTFTAQDFTAFGTTITVKPSWAPDATPQAMDMMDRGTDDGITDHVDLLRDWIATDNRQPGDPMTLTISGLPAGTYSWLSYHHDNHSQRGIFDVTVTDATGSVATTDIQITDTRNSGVVNFEDMARFTTTIVSDGTNPVTLVFHLHPPSSTQTSAQVVNGFELALLHSPSAMLPSPADKATDVPREVVLSWTPGGFAGQHDVCFGTSFDNVNDATNMDPIGSDKVYRARQGVNSYAVPERLDFGQTYYWRIDEVNDVNPDSPWIGDVWSFTVEPIAYPIPGTSITATASSSNSANEGPENTVNGSGLDDSGLLHGNIGIDNMWLSSTIGPQPTWIQYEFDRVYKLHQMLAWNHNTSTEPVIGFGIKEAAIEYSADGANWTTLGTTHEFARAPGAAGYESSTTVDLSGVVAKYVKITANSNWGGFLNQYGLSEVRFFYIPVLAREPSPADGATNVSIGTIDEPIDTTLGFRAGREATMHDVYLSNDEQAVIDGTAPVTTVTEASYGPLPLDIGQTYYWRVDEVNEAETPTTWQGDIWNFTTQEYFVLDDFEDYNDYPPDEIFSTWIDGWGVPTNGAMAANAEPPYVETTIVHGGSQAMPYFYDNSVGYSEASVTLSSQRWDWTIRGIGSLSLWFRGYPASVGSFVEAPASTYTMTASGADIWDTSDEFHFAYKQLTGAGAIIAKVESVEQTHNWARAGVMIRDTLEADSAHAMMAVAANRGLAFDRRPTAGEITSRTRRSAFSAPYWVQIERDIGGIVRASYSADGIEWTELSHEQITMNTPMYIGLALTARNANATCEAVFSNVQITGASGPWANQDIGILSNAPEPMYVALANTGGAPAAVYHDDPNATQIGTWTEWNIDLKGFADQGVNLADVDKLSIGFGDRDNPQAGTSGKMYFDDIRLYPLREP